MKTYEDVTIYLSKENYQEHINLDVVAFSYAHGGAMGAGGEIIVITNDAKIYCMNCVFSDMKKELCDEVCPPLKDCIFGLWDVEKTIHPLSNILFLPLFFLCCLQASFCKGAFVHCLEKVSKILGTICEEWRNSVGIKFLVKTKRKRKKFVPVLLSHEIFVVFLHEK